MLPIRDYLDDEKESNRFLLAKLMGGEDMAFLSRRGICYELLDRLTKKVTRSACYMNAMAHNHFEDISQITSKKLLFKNLKQHLEAAGIDPQEYLPHSFHVQGKMLPSELERLREWGARLGRKVAGWIIKPG